LIHTILYMDEKLLAFYLKKIQKLRRDSKFGGAPHKPVLLLSIIELIDENVIYSNRIYITAQLVAKFKDIWNLLVTIRHQPTFALPFFHMRSEGFWHLINKPGFEIALTKSILSEVSAI
jgi:putative restriction endonuclease